MRTFPKAEKAVSVLMDDLQNNSCMMHSVVYRYLLVKKTMLKLHQLREQNIPIRVDQLVSRFRLEGFHHVEVGGQHKTGLQTKNQNDNF